MREWPYDPMGVSAADLAAAAADVRRFRGRRRTAVVAASALAVAAIVSSRALLGVSTSSLTPTDHVPAPAVDTSPTPAPSATPATPGSDPHPTVPRRTGPSGPGGPAREVTGAAVPTAPSGAEEPADPHREQSAPMVREIVQSKGTRCEVTPSSDSEVCLRSMRTGSGDQLSLALQACPRQPRLSPMVLEFADDREIDMIVTDESKHTVWRWSDSRSFPQRPHEVTIGTAECVTWTTQYLTRTRDGSPLPSGHYIVTMTGHDLGGLVRLIYISFDVP